jgi:hypothetical protein
VVFIVAAFGGAACMSRGDAEQEKLIAELARAAYDAYAARLKQ